MLARPGFLWYHAGGMSDQPLVLTDPALLETLTPKERAFVQHPLVATDPRRAYVEAGYAECNATSGMPYIKLRELRYFIQHYERQRMAYIEVDAKRIRQELAAIAFNDPTDYYDTVDVDGETIKFVRDITRIPEVLRRAIKKIEYGMYDGAGKFIAGVWRIELHDKVAALKALAECFGMKGGKLGAEQNDDHIQQQMLSQLEPEELEALNAIYTKAAGRTKKAASRKRDERAIDVEKDPK